MELLLRINLENYEVKEYSDTGTILATRKGVEGEPDYSIEGEGFVVEFKDGSVYTVDIYDPEVAKEFKDRYLLSVK